MTETCGRNTNKQPNEIRDKDRFMALSSNRNAKGAMCVNWQKNWGRNMKMNSISFFCPNLSASVFSSCDAAG
jgi:hypothetical protein